MKKVIAIILAGFALMSCAVHPQPSLAADQPNVLILGEDSDRDTISRNSRIFRRVLDAISNQLNEEGFAVFDETAITLKNFEQGRSRRTDAELIDIAKSIQRPPIDVAVMFSIYTRVKHLTYTTKISTRVSGRLLNVSTGQRMGNFEVEQPNEINAPQDCSRICILEAVGKEAKILSQDLGSALTIKLSHLVDSKSGSGSVGGSNLPTAYTLVFNGFDSTDINDIEEFIVAFSGYKKHRPIRSSAKHAEYWYETSSDSARLNRNFRKMLDHLGVNGRVSFSGSEFSVEKISVRKKR